MHVVVAFGADPDVDRLRDSGIRLGGGVGPAGPRRRDEGDAIMAASTATGAARPGDRASEVRSAGGVDVLAADPTRVG
ncbi:hypothetical protein Ate01nite_64210 [Actinoplanes teichomyceticus]|nr:hypothetical protein Ate01nite_64210 [Actinoplanes teichomyceticus]